MLPDAGHEVFDRGSLPAMLAARARRASDRRLALDVAAGIVMGVALAILRPPLWMPLAWLAIALAMFGLWGILDREVADRPPGDRRRVLVAGRVLAVVVGSAAALLGALLLFFTTLGLWVS